MGLSKALYHSVETLLSTLVNMIGISDKVTVSVSDKCYNCVPNPFLLGQCNPSSVVNVTLHLLCGAGLLTCVWRYLGRDAIVLIHQGMLYRHIRHQLAHIFTIKHGPKNHLSKSSLQLKYMRVTRTHPVNREKSFGRAVS